MIQHILIFASLMLFTIAFAFRNKWQFEERKNSWLTGYWTSKAEDDTSNTEYMESYMVLQSKANRKWHSWQAVVQLCAFALVGIAINEIQGIPAALTYMAAFWLFFDGILNVIALDKPFFYVGKTAFIDRQFQRFKKPSLAMAITKLIFIVTFSTIYIITSI